ncbi:hypothetical protein AAY473_037938 [Plecturocebus cupreus]
MKHQSQNVSAPPDDDSSPAGEQGSVEKQHEAKSLGKGGEYYIKGTPCGTEESEPHPSAIDIASDTDYPRKKNPENQLVTSNISSNSPVAGQTEDWLKHGLPVRHAQQRAASVHRFHDNP